GVSIAEAARHWRSIQMSCIAGDGSFDRRRAMHFRVMATSAGPTAGSPSWSRRWASRCCRLIFEGLLAAHRGTADAAGIDWKSAIYRKIEEEVRLDRGLTIKLMAKLGGVSRAVTGSEDR